MQGLTDAVLKRCTKCGEIKPLSSFSKHKAGKYGVQSKCRSCVKSWNANYYALNGKVNRIKGAKVQAAWRERTKAAKREKDKAWRQKNLEQRKAVEKAYREVAKSKISEKNKRNYIEKREAVLQRTAQWAKENRWRKNASSILYSSAKRKAVPPWSDPNQVATIYAKAKELSALYGVEFEVDHVVPLRSHLVSGLHCEANLQLMLTSDNRAKGNYRWPDMP